MLMTRKRIVAGLVAALLITLGMATSRAETEQERFKRYRDVYESRLAEIRALPGVTASGVGASRDSTRLRIQLYVAPGTPQSVKDALPTDFDGVPVDVLEMEPVTAQ